MHKATLYTAFCLSIVVSSASLVMTQPLFAESSENIASSNGIDYPDGWQDWAVLSVSHRHDNNTIRVILGNDIAIAASRAGNTNPWPNGAIIGKVVWKDGELKPWPAAMHPEQFVHAEFMFKDANRFADTNGWGWARWLGAEQKAFDQGPSSCISCHTPVKANDWVFTEPSFLPKISNK